MKNYYHFSLPIVAMIFCLSSCSEDKLLSDSATERWHQGLNGEIDKSQDWTTAVSMQLDIIANRGDKVSAYIVGGASPVLLAQQEMHGNGVMRFDVPQGRCNSIGVVCDGASGRKYQRLYITGDKKQVVDVDFNKQTNSTTYSADVVLKTAETRATANSADTPLPSVSGTHSATLNGNVPSGAELKGYNSFGGWAWDAVLEALPENQLAELHNTEEGLSYEFESDGYQGKGVYGDNTILGLSYLYGYTGSTGVYTIGYYTHSKGTYADLEMHDLGDVFQKDYLAQAGSTDYRAKVQYQLDGTDTWYDANFDNLDGEGVLYNEKGKLVTSSNAQRVGDGAVCTFLAHNNYGERVSAMRGLTYRISIPKGLMYGFYLRLNNSLWPAHKTILQNKGINVNLMKGKEINFSNADLNMPQKAGGKTVNYRSSYKKYDTFAFVGFDDSAGAGDGDCNDVVFGFIDADDLPAPHDPKTDPTENYQSWTIGFENLGTDADFDFNDVVARVTPNPVTRKAKVELLAAGCQYKTEFYYGDTRLCEVHEAFGLKAGDDGLYKMVNTGGDTQQAAVVDLGEVDWPEGYTMTDNGSLFHTVATVAKDGTEEKRSSAMDAYIGDSKDVPTAICVAGDWQWPMETTSVFLAYPLIGEWGKNVAKKDFWNWYTQPRSEHIYTPHWMRW